MEDQIKIIECIAGEEGKRYWIMNILKVSDTMKGRLLLYFDV